MFLRVPIAALLLILCAWVPTKLVAAAGSEGRLTGRTLVQVFNEVARIGLQIVYSESLVPRHLTIQREPEAQDPFQRVREMLASHGLTLQPAGDDVWVVVRDELGVVEGTITEDASGRALEGISVHLLPLGRTLRTRADGSFFQRDLPLGRYRLEIESDGVHQEVARVINVRAGAPTRIELSLASTVGPLAEVTVTSSRYSLLADAPQPSLSLGAADMANQPALLEDMLRAVRRFPGTAGSGLSSRSYVRGGDDIDNLVLLDGVPIVDAFHFEGLLADFSLIDPAWIDQLDFYSGVLPIEYSGRMSSVTHLKSRRAKQRFGGRGSLGILNASAMLEGTLPGEGGDWIVAARRGLLDVVAKAFDREYGTPGMADAVAQFRMRSGAHTMVTLGILGAEDDVNLSLPEGSELTAIDSEQAQSWVAIDHEWNGVEVLSRLTFAAISQERRGVVSDAETISGELTDARRTHTATLSQDWRLPTYHDVEPRWGWFYARAQGDYDYRKAVVFAPELVDAFGPTPTADIALAPESQVQSFGVYGGAEWELSEDWRVDAGIRWDRHLFDTGQRESSVDPRVSLLHRSSPRSRWRLAWGRNSQFPTAAELPVERGALRYDALARASFWVLGWDHEFSAHRALRVELYDKAVENPWPRLESRIDPLVLVPELEPDHTIVIPDRARMKGIDVHLLTDLGEQWQGWLSYSGSRAYDVIAGRSELRSWDQSHALSVGLSTERWGWTWTAVATAHTGWPTTPLSVSDSGDIILGARNSGRRPWYGTFDLRAQRVFPLTFGALRVSAEITNLTNRRNVCCTELEFERDATGALVPQARRETKGLLPLLPFVTVAWEF